MAASSHGSGPTAKASSQPNSGNEPNANTEDETETETDSETDTETDTGSEESGSTEYESTSESETDTRQQAGPARPARLAPLRAVGGQEDTDAGPRREASRGEQSSAESETESENNAATVTRQPEARTRQPPQPRTKQPERRTRFTEDIEGDEHAAAAKARSRQGLETTQNPHAESSESDGSGHGATNSRGSGSAARPRPPTRGARSGPSPGDRAGTTAPDLDTAEKGRGGSERPRAQGKSDSDECCATCCSCTVCASCQAGCTNIIRSRFWSWLRRRSAYIVAVIAGLGMVSSGVTGVNSVWTFCSIGGYDLGGLGYCQGGICTIQPFYTLNVPTPSYLPTIVLSGLLLGLSGVGLLLLLYLLYLYLSASCSSGSFTPPHRALLYCCFDQLPRQTEEQTRRLERKAQYENGMTEDRWEALPSSERTAMIDEVRMKSAFEKVMWWGGMVCGGGCLAGAIFWKETVDADEGSAYDLLLWGGMVILLSWLVTSQIYRSNKRGSVATLISGEMDEVRRLRKAAMGKLAPNTGRGDPRSGVRSRIRRGGGTAAGAGADARRGRR